MDCENMNKEHQHCKQEGCSVVIECDIHCINYIKFFKIGLGLKKFLYILSAPKKYKCITFFREDQL
jgi:hypothetical protein